MAACTYTTPDTNKSLSVGGAILHVGHSLPRKYRALSLHAKPVCAQFGREVSTIAAMSGVISPSRSMHEVPSWLTVLDGCSKR